MCVGGGGGGTVVFFLYVRRLECGSKILNFDIFRDFSEEKKTIFWGV